MAANPGFVVAGLVAGYHTWAEYRWSRERRRLTNAVIARDPQHFAMIEAIEKRPKPKQKPPTPPAIGLS